MFFDTAQIQIAAGKGGDGAVAFRREKYVPFGGPSGGDGGHGGNVILFVDPKVNTLVYFRHHHRFKAGHGGDGRTKNMTGANGRDLRIPVPPGTVVRDAQTHELLGDLTQPKAELIVAKGGTPGKGNARFATSTNQAPRMATNGLPGEERTLDLELKLIADVGLVGLPNAGKSTLLASTTAARPKIAAYPFTTLEPNLGVVDLDRETSFIVADIPGLIEGASAGKGLGHEFLRHIERTRILIHLLDGSQPDPIGDFDTLNAELAAFGHGLAGKVQIVAFNKIDLVEAQENWKKVQAVLKQRGVEALTISAATHTNTRELMYRAVQLLKELPEPAPLEPALPVIKLAEGAEPVVIARDDAGAWHVSGKAVERLALRHRFDSEESLMAFQRAVDKMGVLAALRAAGVQEGDTVWIGEDYELEWQD
jgi:GTP-binding protein